MNPTLAITVPTLMGTVPTLIGTVPTLISTIPALTIIQNGIKIIPNLIITITTAITTTVMANCPGITTFPMEKTPQSTQWRRTPYLRVVKPTTKALEMSNQCRNQIRILTKLWEEYLRVRLQCQRSILILILERVCSSIAFFSSWKLIYNLDVNKDFIPVKQFFLYLHVYFLFYAHIPDWISRQY